MLQHDQDLERKLILKTGIDKNYTSEKTFYFRVRLEQIKVAEYINCIEHCNTLKFSMSLALLRVI